MSDRLLLAHRGALGERVENTLPAFERALELGADGVELDVQLSADGEVIVFHDRDLVRLAGRDEAIDALSWSQLSQVALPGGQRIPRLSDLLAVWPATAWLDVELKAGGEAMVDAVLERLDGRDNTFLSSFDPRLLARAKAKGWPHAMGLLLEPQSPAFLHALGGREFGAEAVILDARLCSGPALARYRADGYTLGAYGARDPAHEAALLERAVTWLITDWPRPCPR